MLPLILPRLQAASPMSYDVYILRQDIPSILRWAARRSLIADVHSRNGRTPGKVLHHRESEFVFLARFTSFVFRA